MTAGNEAGFEEILNQQMERKDKGERTMERNILSDIYEKGVVLM